MVQLDIKGGGGNLGKWLLVLGGIAAAAFAVWWFFFRNPPAADSTRTPEAVRRGARFLDLRGTPSAEPLVGARVRDRAARIRQRFQAAEQAAERLANERRIGPRPARERPVMTEADVRALRRVQGQIMDQTKRLRQRVRRPTLPFQVR